VPAFLPSPASRQLVSSTAHPNCTRALFANTHLQLHTYIQFNMAITGAGKPKSYDGTTPQTLARNEQATAHTNAADSHQGPDSASALSTRAGTQRSSERCWTAPRRRSRQRASRTRTLSRRAYLVATSCRMLSSSASILYGEKEGGKTSSTNTKTPGSTRPRRSNPHRQAASAAQRLTFSAP
jgi:alkylhydroperoxidase family enzyme